MPEIDYINPIATSAVIFTLLTVINIYAFIIRDKFSDKKAVGYISLMFSFVGCLIAWASFIIGLIWDMASISVTLIFLSVPISFFPWLIFTRWYIGIIAMKFKLKVKTKGILFNIFNLGFGLIDVYRILMFVFVLWLSASVVFRN